MYNYFNIARNLMTMIRRAYWTENHLVAYQNKMVKHIARYAYNNVPFYHKRFIQLGIKPVDITSMADLNKIPPLTKDELRNNHARMISREYNPSRLRVVATSGSTGKPVGIRISRKEDEFRKAKHLRANICCGQKPRDKWIVIVTPQHQEKMSILQRVFGVYAFIPLSVFDDPSKQISNLTRLKPDVLDGYSSSLLLMAKEARNRGIAVSGPRLIVGGAELVDQAGRQLIENVFDAPFYDQYASIEFERMAWQCQERSEYHIDADSIVMQFLDNNGEEVALGERGEIVCTSLFNRAMPLIRYAIGDVGIASVQGGCSCNRRLPLMRVLEGRKDSLVVLADGRILSPLVIGDGMMFFKFFNHIDQYRVIQKKVDHFKFVIKMKNDNLEQKIVEEELQKYFIRLLRIDGSMTTFDIEFVNEMPLDKSGKFMKVISNVKPRF